MFRFATVCLDAQLSICVIPDKLTSHQRIITHRAYVMLGGGGGGGVGGVVVAPMITGLSTKNLP